MDLTEFGLQAELDRLTTTLDKLDTQMQAIAATEVSPDRLVKVTVNGRGELHELELDPAVLEMPDAAALAASILATVRTATATATAKALELCDSFEEQLT